MWLAKSWHSTGSVTSANGHVSLPLAQSHRAYEKSGSWASSPGVNVRVSALSAWPNATGFKLERDALRGAGARGGGVRVFAGLRAARVLLAPGRVGRARACERDAIVHVHPRGLVAVGDEIRTPAERGQRVLLRRVDLELAVRH